MDYNEFAERIKTKYPEYNDLDNRTLAEKMVSKFPDEYSDVTFDDVNSEPIQEENNGIDISPSNVGAVIGDALSAPIVAMKENIPVKEAYQKNRNSQPEKLPAQDFVEDMAVYSTLPMLKGGGVAKTIGNAVIQGGIPGAVEGLKNNNTLGGAGLGTGIGLGLQSVPYVGKVAKVVPAVGSLVARTVGRVKPETLAQAVKPNSKALDLTEKTAQNLLMNTTEGVQNAYKNLLDKAGLDVRMAALDMPADRHVFASSLQDALDDIFNQYSVSGDKNLNVAYNKAGKIYDMISDLIKKSTDERGAIIAPKFYDLMENVKKSKINWDDKDANLINGILKQVYGEYARRLGNLSPELRKANRAYSKLAQFDDNEGVRRILNPPKTGDVDSASTALRNYNSTVTKGNTNRNIQDLENILVENGYEPFLDNIDDVNAAMDLLNLRTTGDSWLANLVTQSTRPALGLVRNINRSNLPQVYNNVEQVVTPFAERLLTPAVVRGASPLLYGEVSNY